MNDCKVLDKYIINLEGEMLFSKYVINFVGGIGGGSLITSLLLDFSTPLFIAFGVFPAIAATALIKHFYSYNKKCKKAIQKLEYIAEHKDLAYCTALAAKLDCVSENDDPSINIPEAMLELMEKDYE